MRKNLADLSGCAVISQRLMAREAIMTFFHAESLII